MRLAAALTAVGLLAGGSATHPPPNLVDKAFNVNVSADAQSAAGRSGVNLVRLVTASANQALALLPHRGLMVITVSADASQTIPEIGVGGYTDPRSGNVDIWIDPRRAHLRDALETWIPASVAHELDHSSRIRTGPGYGYTLGEAIVSEGLADRFVYQAFPRTPTQPWDHALTTAQAHRYWLEARSQLASPDSQHAVWFFGRGSIPRWTGYTLGYAVVGSYLRQQDLRAARAVGVSAASILAAGRL
jgi:hypothetical protein